MPVQANFDLDLRCVIAPFHLEAAPGQWNDDEGSDNLTECPLPRVINLCEETMGRLDG